MARKFKVVHPVEVDGSIRQVGEVLDEDKFKAPIPQEEQNPDHPDVGEIDSLIGTGHIEEVTE